MLHLVQSQKSSSGKITIAVGTAKTTTPNSAQKNRQNRRPKENVFIYNLRTAGRERRCGAPCARRRKKKSGIELIPDFDAICA